MKKMSNFKVLFYYLRDEKVKLFLYTFIVFIAYTPSFIGAFFWGIALEKLIQKDIMSFTLYLAIWESIWILFYGILHIPKDKLYNYLEIKFTVNVSKDLYKKIDNLPALAFEEIGVGEFINRLYTDPDRVMELLHKLMKLLCKSLIVLFILFIAFKTSLMLGVEILIFAFVMGIISYKYFPKIKEAQESIKKESDNYVKIATENISGIREIKALGIKENVEKNVFDVLDTMFFHTKKVRNYEINYFTLNNIVYFILQFIILFTAGYYVYEGKIAYSLFIVFETYIWKIDEVVESISDFFVNYNKVTVSLKRIDDLLNNKLYDSEKFGDVSLSDASGVITFENVWFKYREDEENTLKGLSLRFEPNKKIAVVGRSGNGKSTIFNLLLRYFDATAGCIKVDGVDIKELTEESLRKSISIIRQAPFLFNLSILDNFRLVKKNVSLKEVRRYCREAYIDDYIMSLPNKYDTIIGEGGINLSGGQKQRLAIARTLLLDTKIILFDEATSALDNESQEYIKKTIDNLVKDHTIIIVAHRLSTIVDADVINVIDKGKLAGSGKHEELLKSSTVYQNLYKNESLNTKVL